MFKNKFAWILFTICLFSITILAYHYFVKNRVLKELESAYQLIEAQDININLVEIKNYPRNFSTTSKNLLSVCQGFPVSMFSEEPSNIGKSNSCKIKFNDKVIFFMDQAVTTSAIEDLIQTSSWQSLNSETDGVFKLNINSNSIPFKNLKKLSRVDLIKTIFKMEKPTRQTYISEDAVEKIILYYLRSMTLAGLEPKVLMYEHKDSSYLLIFSKRETSGGHTVTYYSQKVSFSCTNGTKDKNGSYQPCLSYLKHINLIE